MYEKIIYGYSLCYTKIFEITSMAVTKVYLYNT